MRHGLVAFTLFLMAGGLAIAEPKPVVQPAPKPDDVPPFLHARGGDQPLVLAISGLATGYATVAAGSRIFALCWNGGDAPFKVVVTGPRGAILVNESDLSGNELIKLSKPVALEAGRTYVVKVSDYHGVAAAGSFAAVQNSSLPDSANQGDSDAAASAMALGAADLALSYEAFLRIAPSAGGPTTSAGKAVAYLCHQLQ